MVRRTRRTLSIGPLLFHQAKNRYKNVIGLFHSHESAQRNQWTQLQKHVCFVSILNSWHLGKVSLSATSGPQNPSWHPTSPSSNQINLLASPSGCCAALRERRSTNSQDGAPPPTPLLLCHSGKWKSEKSHGKHTSCATGPFKRKNKRSFSFISH